MDISKDAKKRLEDLRKAEDGKLTVAKEAAINKGLQELVQAGFANELPGENGEDTVTYVLETANAPSEEETGTSISGEAKEKKVRKAPNPPKPKNTEEDLPNAAIPETRPIVIKARMDGYEPTFRHLDKEVVKAHCAKLREEGFRSLYTNLIGGGYVSWKGPKVDAGAKNLGKKPRLETRIDRVLNAPEVPDGVKEEVRLCIEKLTGLLDTIKFDENKKKPSDTNAGEPEEAAATA